MRAKEPSAVVSFHTSTSAFALEGMAKAHGLQGRLAPVPRELSAGCGFAWREPIANKERLQRAMELEGIEYDSIVTLVC